MQAREEHVAKIKAIKGGYWLGASGEKATPEFWEQKSRQDGIEWWYIDHAPNNKAGNKDAKNLWMGQLVRDCSGENKEALWRQPDGSLKLNKNEDLNETMLYSKAKAMGLPNGPIITLPLIEGVCLTFPGHYGELICENGTWYGKEARSGDIGVVQYEIGKRPGTAHQWTNWFYNPFVDYGEGNKMLYLNCPKGEAVQGWQESLLKCGYKMINQSGKVCTADGDFGTGSVNGTNLFKHDEGLPLDGIVDEITYGRMLKKLSGLVLTNTVEVKIPVEVIKEVPTGITQSQLDSEIAKTNARDGTITSLNVDIQTKKTAADTQAKMISTLQTDAVDFKKQIDDLGKEIVTTAEKTATDIKSLQDAAAATQKTLQDASDQKDKRIDVLEETLDELEQKNAELFEQANEIVVPKPEEKPEATTAVPEEPAIVPEVPKIKSDGLFKMILQLILSFFNK